MGDNIMNETLGTVITNCFEEAYNNTMNFIKLHNHSQKEMEDALCFFMEEFKSIVDRKAQERVLKSND